MTRSRIAILALLAAVCAAPAYAQKPNTPNTFSLEEGGTRPPAKIADLAWLEGRWVGKGLGGDVEEAWSGPAGGAMVGYFRLVRDGKPVFYEILTLLEAEGSVEMRLKHVHPDMKGWEEKDNFVTFKLLKQDAATAYFAGLTFRRRDADSLEIFLALRDRATGTVTEQRFEMRRLRP